MMWVSEYLPILIADRFLQQTTANTKQIKDIEERVESLRGVLTAPASDQDNEERTRRDVLRQFVFHIQNPKDISKPVSRRKLTGIIDELRQISEQRGLLKFLNNVNHTNILSGLVQDVAYAVMDYQVCYAEFVYCISWLML